MNLERKDWRSERLWHRLGYVATAGWMLYVVAATDGDPAAPLFEYIFVVPIGMWAAGIAAAWVLRRVFPPSSPPKS